jgi:hypothetical protein
VAKKIIISNKLLNDPKNDQLFEAKIVSLYRYDVTYSNELQGIKGGDRPTGAIAGGNGSFVIGYPKKHSTVIIEFIKIGGIGIGSINIELEKLRNLNNITRITADFLEKLRASIVGIKTMVRLIGHDESARSLKPTYSLYNRMSCTDTSEYSKYLGDMNSIWELINEDKILVL